MKLKRVYTHGIIERAGDGDGEKPLRIVAATEGRKADGIDLKMANVDLARYDGNPIIGYGHDYYGRASLPIGRAAKTVVEGKRLMIDPEFDADDEFAVNVERKLRKGYLNAVSIGFDAHDIDEAGVPGRWELFETSVVPLPLDAQALVDSGRARALDLLYGDLRAGKVLSAKNKGLLKDAIAALGALLDAAGDEPDDSDEEQEAPRLAPSLANARARARLAELVI